MANIQSAKKAIRSSAKKKVHNLVWEQKIKKHVKDLKHVLVPGVSVEETTKSFIVLQKTLDKASKEKVIHKNKANRIKSRYAKRIATLLQKEPSKRAGRRTK